MVLASQAATSDLPVMVNNHLHVVGNRHVSPSSLVVLVGPLKETEIVGDEKQFDALNNPLRCTLFNTTTTAEVLGVGGAGPRRSRQVIRPKSKSHHILSHPNEAIKLQLCEISEPAEDPPAYHCSPLLLTVPLRNAASWFAGY